MLRVVHRMAKNLLSILDLPTAWGNPKLKTLWKGKGSKSDPTKYRVLSIGSTVCKPINNIIMNRIRSWYEAQLTDEQNGFRKNRGTTDGIYEVKLRGVTARPEFTYPFANHFHSSIYLKFILKRSVIKS